ncbi:MAG: hypothetical protein ACUVTG_09470, partial [Candidatus Oleimicrobiaceae bacterium]
LRQRAFRDVGFVGAAGMYCPRVTRLLRPDGLPHIDRQRTLTPGFSEAAAGVPLWFLGAF